MVGYCAVVGGVILEPMPAYPQLGEAKAGELGDWVRNTQGGGGGEQTFQYNREREREKEGERERERVTNTTGRQQ